MSQRLGIAAALLGQPKYLMLDEPANGLDPEGIAWLREFIKDYADQGNAVFISSHLLSEMAQMADNVVVIGKGKLIADTSVDQLTAGSTHSYAFVRSGSSASDKAALQAALKALGKPFKAQDGGFTVTGVKTDAIGQAAFKAKVPILELSEHSATLEEAFLEITAGAQEYRTADAQANARDKDNDKGKASQANKEQSS
jgi:ABC-2 type transport system ATP-binding protein